MHQNILKGSSQSLYHQKTLWFQAFSMRFYVEDSVEYYTKTTITDTTKIKNPSDEGFY